MRLLISISVVTNVALAALLAFSLLHSAAPAASPVGTDFRTNNRAGADDAPLSSSTNDIADTTIQPVKNSADLKWDNIYSQNHTKYVRNLRAIRCPEETIRDIITAEIDDEARTKLEPLLRSTEVKYWQDHDSLPVDQMAEFNDARRQAERAKRTELKALLGTAITSTDSCPSLDSRDPLMSASEDIKEKLADMMSSFHEQEQKILLLPERFDDDEKRLRDLRELHREELGKILKDDELFEYEVRYSGTARNLAASLMAFCPTETEFRAMFELVRAEELASDTEFARRGSIPFQQFKTVLTEDRYREYELTRDYDYCVAAEITDRLGLTRETARKIFALQLDVDRTKSKINSDTTLSPDQRSSRLQFLKTSTEQQIIDALGEKGFNLYKRRVAWLCSVAP